MTLRNYAAVGSKILPEKEDKGFIDLNTEKLCSYVCVNYLVEGGEDRKILPDSEYPPWLFELKLGRRKELEDLDPEVDGWLYWRAYRLKDSEELVLATIAPNSSHRKAKAQVYQSTELSNNAEKWLPRKENFFI
ncbi:Ribosomal protein L37 domain containing protein [Dirofilaria immitis]|nr:Ribosomal protein L37 domain containing protein [Dirofilaria immitis]